MHGVISHADIGLDKRARPRKHGLERPAQPRQVLQRHARPIDRQPVMTRVWRVQRIQGTPPFERHFRGRDVGHGGTGIGGGCRPIKKKLFFVLTGGRSPGPLLQAHPG